MRAKRKSRVVVCASATPHPTLSPIASNGREDEGFPTRSPYQPALIPTLRILAVGRLSYFKGIDVLLRAIADVAETSLVVIGDGECRSALEQQARSLGIEARVQFTGRVDMDAAGEMALRAAYENADVFCLPSTDRAESFGLVLLEAMRARRQRSPVRSPDQASGSSCAMARRVCSCRRAMPRRSADAAPARRGRRPAPHGCSRRAALAAGIHAGSGCGSRAAGLRAGSGSETGSRMTNASRLTTAGVRCMTRRLTAV